MESKSINNYIYFGKVLRWLQDVNETQPNYNTKNVLEHIEIILNRIEEYKLPVTERAAHPLKRFRDRLSTDLKEKKESLSSEEAQELRDILVDLEKTLEFETGGQIVYLVTDKRLDVNKLVNGVSSLMAPGVYDSLPWIARYDFNEAGLCIAFVRPTAAAFHLLRGTEAALHAYYCNVYKRNRIKKPRMWGPMTNHLRERKSEPIPPVVLLNNLDNIRRSFRNPTQHPELTYNIDEVQDLFGLCIEVVNRMRV